MRAQRPTTGHILSIDFFPIFRQTKFRSYSGLPQAYTGGVYYQYIFFPIFRQTKFRSYSGLPQAYTGGVYYQYIFFPIFCCYYSLYRQLFQVYSKSLTNLLIACVNCVWRGIINHSQGLVRSPICSRKSPRRAATLRGLLCLLALGNSQAACR